MRMLRNAVKHKFRAFRFCTLFSLAFSVFFLVVSCLFFVPITEAQTHELLASSFAPVLQFAQGEKFFPTSVDYVISSSVLRRHLSSGSSVLVDATPTPSSLGAYTSSDLFLDNKLITLDAIAVDYASEAESVCYYTYVHVVSDGSTTIIQYWLFYVYNNGPLNDHQGDIEVVQVFLDVSGNPQTLLCSQHSSGENAAWGDVEKHDNHPIVYVAQGSHANYFRSYQGRMGIENDVVGSGGLTLLPDDVNLVILKEGTGRPLEQSWLDFAGRWGHVGTDEEVALGMAGPLGPVFNQDGVRWAQPEIYLGSTLTVGSVYFILAWLVANFLLLFTVYTVIRGSWKVWGIVRLSRKGGLLVKKFVKGRGGLGLVLGISAILLTVLGLALPWYTITASSETGPLAQQGGVTLMTIDGINGLRVNMFLSSGGDATSGYRNLFSMQLPFAIILASGLVLLALDIIGIRSGKSIGIKFIFGAITSLLPFVMIFIFIMQLPSFLPWASSIAPGQQIPAQVGSMVRTVASSPVYGSTSQPFPVVGTTTVNWGFGIGAYLFVVAAVIRIVAGLIMRTAPVLQEKPIPPPPPPPM